MCKMSDAKSEMDTRSDICKLNDQVDKIVISELKKSVDTKETIDNDVDAVSTHKRKVYKDRHTWIPAVIMVLCVSLNAYELFAGQILSILISSCVMFFWYDFLSGVLHIVLDNPDFINFPGIDDSCLEFQWHHRIPTDIISKSFLQVCGDLNVLMLLLLSFYLLPKFMFCCEYRSALAVLLVANKVLMAYFGQYCHRMSHTPLHSRPKWVNFMQDKGLMISSKEHLKHHHNYDCNFCIGSGLCNPILRFVLANVTSNKYILLAFFLGALFADIPIFLSLLKLVHVN